ncbi:Cysteinyl-tRNA synthetase [Hordeum vulgare]|nr:Cysteinyl-tRNA synthetase [Hordeum vulgare]
MTQTSGFNMEQAKAEFIVSQAEEMAEQHAILESIHDEAYVEAKRSFIEHERVAIDALSNELDAQMDAEADTEEP